MQYQSGRAFDHDGCGPATGEVCVSRHVSTTNREPAAPGHWVLTRGFEYITPRRRNYGRVAVSQRWARFSGPA